MKIFGFGHRSRVGKNTASIFLSSYIRQSTRGKNVVVSSFGAKVKSVTHDLYSWAGLESGEFYEIPENEHLRDVKLPYIDKTPVQIWIEFGTTVGRACYYGTWLQYPLQQKFDYLIISDVRFHNEVEAIQKTGGKVFKIKNPSAPIRDSVADNMLEGFTGWDGTLVNSGDFKSFNDLIVDTFKDLI